MVATAASNGCAILDYFKIDNLNGLCAQPIPHHC